MSSQFIDPRLYSDWQGWALDFQRTREYVDHETGLINLLGGADWEHYHLTQAQATDLTDGGASTLHKHAHNTQDGIQGGAASDYYHLTGAQTTDLTDGGTTTLHSHDFSFQSAASITLNTGTGTGTVTNLQTMLDGNVYHIDEVTGAPGFDLEVNFTGVTRIRGVQVRFFYDGTATHDVHVEMRNYATSAWDVMTSVNGTPDYVTLFWLLPSAANYIDGSGNSIVRFYHVTSGNAAHNMDIDYVGLVQ